MRAALLAPLFLLATGCLSAAALTDAPTAYRFLQIDGTIERPRDEHTAGVCGYDATPEIDEAERTIRFHNDGPDPDRTRLLVAGIVWDRTYCGVAHVVWGALPTSAGTIERDVPGFGTIRFDVLEDGRVRVDGHELHRSRQITFEHEPVDRSRGSLRVHDHGAWPSSGLMIG